MAAILDTLLQFAAQDVVAVFDQNFRQVFTQARALKATVKPESKIMQHPIETGATTTDHRIILPVEIELSLILSSNDYGDVYQQVSSFYNNGTLLVVQTRSGIYTNQLISKLPTEEDTQQYNALTMALHLQEVQFVTAQYTTAPRNPKNSNTVDRGTQQAVPAPPVDQSKLREILR